MIFDFVGVFVALLASHEDGAVALTLDGMAPCVDAVWFVDGCLVLASSSWMLHVVTVWLHVVGMLTVLVFVSSIYS